jgi:mxaD protein
VLELSESVDIEAPAADVWQLVGDFANPRAWTPGLDAVSCTGNATGSRRVLRFGANEIHEELVDHDANSRALTYRWITGGLPVAEYASTLRVEALTPRLSRVVWSARCEPHGVTALQLERMVRGAYRRSLLHAAALLSSPGDTIRGARVSTR